MPHDNGTRLTELASINDGLYVSALGMGMVMVVLVLLAVTVWGVAKGDRAVESWRESRRATSAPESAVREEDVPRSQDDELAKIAVISVAIALVQTEAQVSDIGQTRSAAYSAETEDEWVSQGLARQRTRSGNVGTWGSTG